VRGLKFVASTNINAQNRGDHRCGANSRWPAESRICTDQKLDVVAVPPEDAGMVKTGKSSGSSADGALAGEPIDRSADDDS
jgi:hypothetical protein